LEKMRVATLSTTSATRVREISFSISLLNNKIAKKTEYIRHIHLAGEMSDRERCMRTLEKGDSPILGGYQIYHNYIRPHEALEGKTPSEVAGIKVGGENKWLTLIQNASKKP
jgi:hypothetical protein